MSRYSKQPPKDKDVTFVEVESSNERESAFDAYLVLSVRLGRLRKAGTQRVLTEDGKQFENLKLAAAHLLHQRGDVEYATALRESEIPEQMIFSGVQLAAMDKWADLCKLRGINPEDAEAILQTYTIPRLEQLHLELTQRGTKKSKPKNK